jgi:hypothetical protein
MKIENIELTLLDVPFTEHTNKHLGYWLPHWRIIQICTVTLTGASRGTERRFPTTRGLKFRTTSLTEFLANGRLN